MDNNQSLSTKWCAIHRCGLDCRPQWHYHCIHCQSMLLCKPYFIKQVFLQGPSYMAWQCICLCSRPSSLVLIFITVEEFNRGIDKQLRKEGRTFNWSRWRQKFFPCGR